MDTYYLLITLVVLILLSGFFSASETALTAFEAKDLESIKSQKKVKLLKTWLTKPNELLTGILIGNNVVNILSSALATTLAYEIFGEGGKALAIVTIVMTITILIFGEITPKIVAKNRPSEASAFVIRTIYLFSIVTKPFIIILVFVSKIISRLFGIKIDGENMMITEKDIISYVNVGEAEGAIEFGEKEMIHSIIEFSDTVAKEVMTPRASMFALDKNKNLREVWDDIRENGFSRIPVYGDEGIDNIVGVLYVKDLIDILIAGNDDRKIENYIRKGYFVPDTKSIMEILEEFKLKKVHMAIVLDEYGGTEGLLTIEDLLEEIVGEIKDEYDHQELEPITKVGHNIYEIDAMLDIETINKDLGIDLEESEGYESLGGLILSSLGRVAEKGDLIEFEGATAEVLEIDKRRISRVLLKKGAAGQNPVDIMEKVDTE